jgi:hypothetical protein
VPWHRLEHLGPMRKMYLCPNASPPTPDFTSSACMSCRLILDDGGTHTSIPDSRGCPAVTLSLFVDVYTGSHKQFPNCGRQTPSSAPALLRISENLYENCYTAMIASTAVKGAVILPLSIVMQPSITTFLLFLWICFSKAYVHHPRLTVQFTRCPLFVKVFL